MTAMPYERPVLIRHQPGLMNKFGRVNAMRPQTHIEGIAVEDLVARYGSPLFVFSERIIQDRYRELRDAFALRWPRVRLAWSYKTNYLDAVCTLFHREGAWAEVVSEFEYDKAMRLGVPPEQVHFNGPYKSRAVLERALPAGTIVHIDNFDELALCEEVAMATGCRPRVAIRVSLAAEGTPAWSRFGFNLDNGQAMDAARRLLAGDRLELCGLHTHMGTFITEPGAYRDAAAKLARMANELRERFGVVMDFLDLGGGLASHNTLKAQYLPGDQATPSFRAYADAVLEGLAELDAAPSELPTLVLESGRALVDDAGSLISTVLANKRLPDGRRDLVVDAGVNILFTSFWYKHDLVPAQDFRPTLEPTVVHGPLCMNIDVVRETMLLPPMKVGERVVFRNVGAYNVTQWMQFITYRPAVVLVGRDGQHALMRRAEDLQAVVAQEEVPRWLK
jgi:diaminopimelate decarboxylase